MTKNVRNEVALIGLKVYFVPFAWIEKLFPYKMYRHYVCNLPLGVYWTFLMTSKEC